MHLSTLFVSTAFVLAGMSAALPIRREKMLVTRFADSDFLGDIEARGYHEEAGLYSRGCILSKTCIRPDPDSRASSFSEYTMNTYSSSSHSPDPRHPPSSATLITPHLPHPVPRTGSRLSGSTERSWRH
ncbi:hypothetical protein M378DRAFT_158291 [Amanita muscaria Koide BX008]|uniref:Uncharacterized protein n=1 Tax=Amanita muscaria (strain Koide BX008) TaxID=946122 RepID=A0A0C2XHS9_AMAMK|nr:hypothetical protein M378DRAFT_158291 [Amanita muscaria Koide BX008]